MTGVLMPIGGAEDHRANRSILKRFVHMCGGENARITVVPSASSFPRETARAYEEIFTRLGAREVRTLHIQDRAQAREAESSARIQDSTGIFFSGGDQLRLMTLIGGTRLAENINACFRRGVHIAGTSAGASAMSKNMIAFGRSGAEPSQRMVQMALGLGLSESLIIDQHFRQRNRLGRLITAVTLNPGLVGVGVDEDTALVMNPDGCWEVIGSGSVTLVDGRPMEYTDIYAAKRYDPFTVRGVQTQVLPAGTILDYALIRQ